MRAQTNIAESSITIPDVTVVVDFCLSRMMEFNDSRQMPALMLKLASKVSNPPPAGQARIGSRHLESRANAAARLKCLQRGSATLCCSPSPHSLPKPLSHALTFD